MSDTMLLGVLRMPIDYIGAPLSPMAQFVARAREAADRIEADAKEIERLTTERNALKQELDLRRKSGSASDRLHNICEGLREDADSSPFSREEWDRLDAENVALHKERDALRNTLRQARAALKLVDLGSLVPDYGSGHFAVQRRDKPDIEAAMAAIDAAMKEKP